MTPPTVDIFWESIRSDVAGYAAAEPILQAHFNATILNHTTFEQALVSTLANMLGTDAVPATVLRTVFNEAFAADASLSTAAREDATAYRDRDAACNSLAMPLLYFKGFHAVQAQRIAHWLWLQGRCALALYLQSQVAQLLDVDIHPAAVLGGGLMIDHATGVVIGETSVIGHNVSLLHDVTLGGSGTSTGCDRHPKIGDGVLISTGAKILGCITVGEGAKVGAGSLVLTDVPPHTTVAGVPAKIVGHPHVGQPALDMDHQLGDETA